MGTLGVITIGQAPRRDMVPEMRTWLPADSLHERGALDGLDREAIALLAPTDGDESLTTLLVDGSSVVVGRAGLLDPIQAHIDNLERIGVDVTLVVCTGEFPPFRHTKPLLMAERLLTLGVAAVVNDAPVGIICPLPEQEQDSRTKFADHLPGLVVASATPYADGTGGIEDAARRLAEGGAHVLVLDCMGYTQQHRRAASEASGLPVILARSVVGRLAAELTEGGQ